MIEEINAFLDQRKLYANQRDAAVAGQRRKALKRRDLAGIYIRCSRHGLDQEFSREVLFGTLKSCSAVAVRAVPAETLLRPYRLDFDKPEGDRFAARDSLQNPHVAVVQEIGPFGKQSKRID